MKILQINSVCGVGSTGRIATDIAKVCEENGYESYIIYGRGNKADNKNYIKLGNKLDNYIHVLQTRIFDNHSLCSNRNTKTLIEMINKIDPDIIHLHNLHGYYLNVQMLFEYLKKIKKPIVWTLHDCWSFTGHCAYFDYVGCSKWKSICNNCEQRGQYPSSIMQDGSERNYKIKKELFTGIENLTIVTPSEWLANLVKQSFLKDYQVEVINNGIDLEVFKPTESNFRQQYHINEKTIVLGVASSWDKRKGLDVFERLSHTLGENKQIVIVGVDQKQINKLPDNIISIKRTNNVKELAQIYSAADFFFNPTYEDNFPTTNLEALACGTPVITFNTGGSVESIDSKTGVVLNKDDFLMLEGIIDQKNIVAADCRKRAMEKYDKKIMYKKYLDIYKRVVL